MRKELPALRGVSAEKRCSECKILTEDCCLRCGRPLCVLHRPSPYTRCSACERTYLERRPRTPLSEREKKAKRAEKQGFACILVSLVPLALYLLSISPTAMLFLSFAGTLSGLLTLGTGKLAKVLSERGEKEARAYFLSERKNSPQLNAPPN